MDNGVCCPLRTDRVSSKAKDIQPRLFDTQQMTWMDDFKRFACYCPTGYRCHEMASLVRRRSSINVSMLLPASTFAAFDCLRNGEAGGPFLPQQMSIQGTPRGAHHVLPTIGILRVSDEGAHVALHNINTGVTVADISIDKQTRLTVIEEQCEG
ncbi:hypothetical protein BDZ89DRAFT_1109372 [Hymenopellis radicata]|nr:hypothetical protein BDZ89DRAFT_1109372 [Hymenopellis radicata]